MPARPQESRPPNPRPQDPRGGYLGYVAHEVRNPLSTALWSAELLARMAAAERGGARGEKLTAMCLRSLGRVRQLIEDHFLCERLDAQGIPVRPESMTLREVLDEVIARRPADAPPVEVELQDGLLVQADRVLLDRALEALVSVIGREGTAGRVMGRTRDGRAELRFEGYPPGPDALEDPRKGSPGDPKGRSLSLPLARRAAQALGGTLALDGAVLVLAVPSAEADQPPLVPVAPP
ncbi:MAG: histidine kinase dimerization/phospho-acceptor domain-containing protein [Anaeromyxobacter sp.]